MLMATIQQAFAANEYPGDAFLQGSYDGCEPEDEVGPFRGQRDWQALDPAWLDAHSTALSFFSVAGFRFFLPAYLLADLQGQLQIADPVFHLTHGLYEATVTLSTPERMIRRQIGAAALVNPRRYGAMTFADLARYRLSAFTQEEAQALVAYLSYKRDTDAPGSRQSEIEAALKTFWLERARHAPTAQRLQRHLEEERQYLE